MKQLLLLVAMTVAGGIAAPYHPFWGLLLYYALAVLRPQHLWAWALPVEWRWSLFAAVIIFVSVLLNIHRLIFKGRLTAITLLMMAYGLTLLISCLMADNPMLAAHWGQEHAKIIIIAIIATLCLDQLWQLRILTVMILLMVGYIAWEVNYMYLFKSRLDVFHYGYGGLDNNGAGLLMAMGAPLAYTFGVAAEKPWQRMAAWGVALVILHAVMMTYSRGAMLATLVGTIWLFIQHRHRKQTIVIAVAACLAVSVLAGKEIRERFLSTRQYQEDRSAMSRMESWKAAWTMAWERPLTGHGIRNANLYSANYGADRQGRTIHSVYLQIAADSGIPSMLLYSGMMGLALASFGRCRRMCSRARSDCQDIGPPQSQQLAILKQYEHIALGLQGSLIIFAFGGLFLSLEVFELSWLLMVMAAVMPVLLQEHIASLTNAQTSQEPAEEAKPCRRAHGVRKRPLPALPPESLDDLLHSHPKGWVHP